MTEFLRVFQISQLSADIQSRGISAHDIRTFGRARGGQNDPAPVNQAPPASTVPDIPEVTEDQVAEDDIEEQIVIAESSTTSSQTVAVEIPVRKKPRTSTRKKPKKNSDDEFSASDEEVDLSKYGRASFSHKKRAPSWNLVKLIFVIFVLNDLQLPRIRNKVLTARDCCVINVVLWNNLLQRKMFRNGKRTKVGKGTAKMILEGKAG